MKLRRFRVPRLAGRRITLPGREARHALRVLRLRVGTEVLLFDDDGREGVGRIVAARPDACEVELDQPPAGIAAPAEGLTLATAVPRGERADWLVEKCAELGVRACLPVRFERSSFLPGDGKLLRWRRKAAEAAKQSGQTPVMRIDDPLDLNELLRRPAPVAWYGAPGGAAPAFVDVLLERRRQDGGAALFIVGPEGGFTPDEIRGMEAAGAVAVRLAGATLRVETAAVAAAALWAAFAPPRAG
jgi:16S rRNA (uracil1498-N3)-methyltransferase